MKLKHMHKQRGSQRKQVQDRATFTAKELAAYLGLSDVMVYRMLKTGEIPRRLAGKRYIIPRAAIEEWLKSTPTNHGRGTH
jgi:excisionase family DNA binding protein